MKPYSLQSESIRNLFNNIAPTYDFLNHLLSLRRDIYWRKKAVRELKGHQGWMLDIATGTGDVAIEMIEQGNGKRKVFGLDFSEPMIRKAQEKLLKRNLVGKIVLGLGDALFLPFRNNSFVGLMIAFGLRNIPQKEQALTEMVRVVRPGGKVVVLEFTLPERGPMKRIYPFYLKRILPRVGGWISGDRNAYAYLPDSVSLFRSTKDYEKLMITSGLREISSRLLTGGIVSIISGIKKNQ